VPQYRSNRRREGATPLARGDAPVHALTTEEEKKKAAKPDSDFKEWANECPTPYLT
jgi:hypothetical protein